MKQNVTLFGVGRNNGAVASSESIGTRVVDAVGGHVVETRRVFYRPEDRGVCTFTDIVTRGPEGWIGVSVRYASGHTTWGWRVDRSVISVLESA